MTNTELAFALTALLVTPGPTNALLALKGAGDGFRRGLALLPVVILAYLATVAPLALWGAPLTASVPLLRQLLTGAAAAWVAYLALRLWHLPAPGGPLPTRPVTARDLALTTLLNPKALIIGLVLLPTGNGPVADFALLALAITAVSALWLAIGAQALAQAGPRLNKMSALWLALLSALMAAKALAG